MPEPREPSEPLPPNHSLFPVAHQQCEKKTLSQGWHCWGRGEAAGILESIYLLTYYLIKAHNDSAICSKMPSK